MENSEWPLGRLRPNANNPRQDVRGDRDGFDELVESIRVRGVLQPLIATTDGVILAGHRRFEAAKEAGLSSVPVRLFDSSDPNDEDIVCLIENLLRTDLTPIEIGRYLIRLEEHNKMSIGDISAATGISRPTVNRYLRVMRGPEAIKEALAQDRIGIGAAAALAKHDAATVMEIIDQPDLTEPAIREYLKTKTKSREITYQEKRRRDISIVLETLEEIGERLEPYAVNPSVTFGGAIAQVERCMQEGSEWLAKLQNHLVDWAMILRKQEDRQPLPPVETRNRSSLQNQ